jgi:hypothetical protein
MPLYLHYSYGDLQINSIQTTSFTFHLIFYVSKKCKNAIKPKLLMHEIIKSAKQWTKYLKEMEYQIIQYVFLL